MVGNGVDCISGAARRVVVARRPGGGVIGRTASQYWVAAFAVGVGVCEIVALGVTISVASAGEVAPGSGLATVEAGVSVGEAVGDFLLTTEDAEVFFFFRGFGVGVGRTKNFFSLSPSVSSFSSV